MSLPSLFRPLLALVSVVGIPFTAGAREPSSQPLPALDPPVKPSPTEPKQVALPDGARVVDLAVSARGPQAAVALQEADGKHRILLWSVGSAEPARGWTVPETVSAIALHPRGDALLVAMHAGQKWRLARQPLDAADWKPTVLVKLEQPVARLVIGPRPFVVKTGDDEKDWKHPTIRHRLFVARQLGKGKTDIVSFTDDGKHAYVLTGAATWPGEAANTGRDGSLAKLSSAIPLGFHPAGHRLLFHDAAQCPAIAPYEQDHFGALQKLAKSKLPCKGALTFLPNGLGLTHWLPGRAGVALHALSGGAPSTLAGSTSFVAPPRWLADGAGLVGAVAEGAHIALAYVPQPLPLADVANAWMFVRTPDDGARLARDTGLFRPTTGLDQLYQLYDTESYASCGGYSSSAPARPYFVTTDLFWESFAAAFEGVFIVTERMQTVPAFWKFVSAASKTLQVKEPASRPARVFAALEAVKSGAKNAEAALIRKASGHAPSPALGVPFNYGELKPRSHYTKDPKLAAYFKAMHYLTTVHFSAAEMTSIQALPAEARAAARDWIAPYLPFISPPRRPLVWSDEPFKAPAYVKSPKADLSVFPLSWGWDNEILHETTAHSGEPDDAVMGPKGPRVMPSALDVAAVLGSPLALAFLRESGAAAFPRLEKRLLDLRARYRADAGGDTLYARWLAALAVQWADGVGAPGGEAGRALWEAKRLQTGLSSWATLRHATLLVNERDSAECGEGGFEPLVMDYPRGAVEPDPATFEAIARLFEALGASVERASGRWSGNLPHEMGDETTAPLKKGILARLRGAAATARRFGAIADKHVRGQSLSEQDYSDIHHAGGAAEHDFLVFKSLGNASLAISLPDPMPKVADVFDGNGALLLAGVGLPLEWDQLVPFNGRRQVVKGAVYAFHEATSSVPIDDDEWRKPIAGRARPKWISRFVSAAPLREAP